MKHYDMWTYFADGLKFIFFQINVLLKLLYYNILYYMIIIILYKLIFNKLYVNKIIPIIFKLEKWNIEAFSLVF